MCKGHAFCHQTIHVWRMDGTVAQRADRIAPLLIRIDEDDIRSVCQMSVLQDSVSLVLSPHAPRPPVQGHSGEESTHLFPERQLEGSNLLFPPPSLLTGEG